MLFHPQRCMHCLQNYILSELLICSALLWQNALTEYPLANFASDNIHSFVSGRACKCSSLKWLSNACWLMSVAFLSSSFIIQIHLSHFCSSFLQTNACAKKDWCEAGHTSVRCWCKSHPLPVWHSYLVNKENCLVCHLTSCLEFGRL